MIKIISYTKGNVFSKHFQQCHFCLLVALWDHAKFPKICQVKHEIDGCNALDANLVHNSPFALTGTRTGN